MDRKRWVDIVKGIGILLVIIGHCRRPDLMLKYIQSFHMPLFFFVSGYLFREQTEFLPFFKRKAKVLLKPYAIYGGANFILWMSYLLVTEGINAELGKLP